MRATSVWLVLVGGCSSGLSSSTTRQEVADPSPTLTIVGGNFNTPVGGSSIAFCDPSTTPCAAPPPIQVRWGTPGGGTEQSGLGFDPTAPLSVAYGTAFSIGTLSHFNQPTVSGTAATGVSLSLELRVDPSLGGTPLFDQTVSIPFTIDETPNVEPCAYPSTTPCADKITFGTSTFSLASTSNYTIYDLNITGFVDPATSATVDGLISQENGTSSAELLAVLTEHCVDANNNGICDDHEVAFICPCDSDWVNHGQYVSCVAHASKVLVNEGYLTDQQRADIVSTAGQSQCGK